MTAKLEVPVVLIAFNRPDHIRQTLQRVREMAPSRLFLVADAPRPGRADDVEQCAAVRRELEAIDWDCKVERRYAESNLGCSANIELGLDWVFGQVDRAIILEDDCLPDHSFFRYADELLDRYADDDRIWQVAGSVCSVPSEFFGGDSYTFTHLGAVWGWATWSRAWKAHRAVFPRDHTRPGPGGTMAPERTEPPVIPPGVLLTTGGHRYFTDVGRSTGEDAFVWDSHFWLSMVCHAAIAISPSVNMVENIGMGAEATHTQTDRATAPAESLAFPLRHPKSIATNDQLERDQELQLVRGYGRLARTVGKILGRGRLRRLASRVSSSPIAWRVARTGAAAASQLRRSNR